LFKTVFNNYTWYKLGAITSKSQNSMHFVLSVAAEANKAIFASDVCTRNNFGYRYTFLSR